MNEVVLANILGVLKDISTILEVIGNQNQYQYDLSDFRVLKRVDRTTGEVQLYQRYTSEAGHPAGWVTYSGQ